MAFNSKPEKVSLELAVLRYRAVIGTASMNKFALIEGVTKALESALLSYKPHLEKIAIFTEKEGKSTVSYVGNTHYICGWPMLTFDIRLLKRRRLLSHTVTIRVYVASDMLRNAQVKSDTIRYCEENNIVIVDNLFQFCQPNSDPCNDGGANNNAENDILDQIERHLQLKHNNNSTHSNNNSPISSKGRGRSNSTTGVSKVSSNHVDSRISTPRRHGKKNSAAAMI